MRRFLRIFWRVYPAALASMAVAALYFWWRDGMWWYGELPTHGMLLTVGFSLAGLVFFALMRLMGRR